jgi:hypothetical protein
MESFKSYSQNLQESSLARVHQHTQERNVGMITAHRGEYSPEENHERNKSLTNDLKDHKLSYIKVKGNYVENHGTKDAKTVSEHSYLVVGKKGHDNGHLKGVLKKLGHKYDQDSILHKSHDSKTAQLHGTSDRENAWPKKDDVHDVGDFHPSRAGEFHTALRNKKTFSFGESVEFYQPEIGKSFFNRNGSPERLF